MTDTCSVKTMQVSPKARFDAVWVTEENFNEVAKQLPFLEMIKLGEYYNLTDAEGGIWGVFLPTWIVYIESTGIWVEQCSDAALRELYNVAKKDE